MPMVSRIMSKLETDGAPMWLVAASIALAIVERNAKHFDKTLLLPRLGGIFASVLLMDDDFHRMGWISTAYQQQQQGGHSRYSRYNQTM